MVRNKKIHFHIMNKKLVQNLLGIIFVFLAMAAAAMLRDGKLLGHSLEATDPADSIKIDPVTELENGSVKINTTSLATDVTGYAGPVPVEITFTEGRIDSISPLDNSETPGFFKRVIESPLLSMFTGKTAEEAIALQVDAVTGATYSSTALIANIRSGAAYYANESANPSRQSTKHGWKFYAALAVVVCGAVVSLKWKNKRYRVVQQLLNVGVLGFWTGTFLDYTAILSIMSNGLTASASLVTILMVIVAFIYPLFGKKDYYCAWICPLGSLQELAGRCNPRHKIKMSPRVVKSLQWFRTVLWGGLMLCLWAGFFTSWIDYELFTSFMVNEAATGVVIAGALFVVLSLFITRPYCRCVCPTGALFRISENIDMK